MKHQKFNLLAGKVIYNASIAGVKLNSTLPIYNISKSGVISLMKILAHNLAPKITVNSNSPGYRVTSISNNNLSLIKQMLREGFAKNPLNRLGIAEDVVYLKMFLASTTLNFITGYNFMIDDGIADIEITATFFKSEI